MVNELRKALQTAQSNRDEFKDQLIRLSELGRLKRYGGGRKRARVNGVKPPYTGTDATN